MRRWGSLSYLSQPRMQLIRPRRPLRASFSSCSLLVFQFYQRRKHLQESSKIVSRRLKVMAEEEISYRSATRDVLLSAAKTIGSQCVDENLAFAKCKAQNSDPEACLKQASAVIECNSKVLSKISTKCPDQFEEFRKCMDKTQMKFAQCRSEEKAFTDAFNA